MARLVTGQVSQHPERLSDRKVASFRRRPRIASLTIVLIGLLAHPARGPAQRCLLSKPRCAAHAESVTWVWRSAASLQMEH